MSKKLFFSGGGSLKKKFQKQKNYILITDKINLFTNPFMYFII